MAFAVRAHQESKRRESPDLVSSDCEIFVASALTNGHTSPSLITPDSNPGQLPSLSLPLLRSLHLPVTLQPDEKGKSLKICLLLWDFQWAYLGDLKWHFKMIFIHFVLRFWSEIDI